jgi:hypothetical protein
LSPPPRDPWRLPTIVRLGDQLRELERAGRPSTARRSGLSRRAIGIFGAAIAVAVACLLLIFVSGRSAQARSIVNQAPAAAQGSGTVRFQSALTVQVAGRPRDGITESGAIDFKTGAFTTTVRFGHAARVFERLSSGGVLYAAALPLASAHHPRGTRWLARPLPPRAHGAVPFEGDAFTEPASVFRALSGVRGPVRSIGRETLGGVVSTRYRVLTNLETFLGPSQGHIENPRAYRRVKASLDVWIDARGRPLRVKETFTGPSAAGPTTMTTVIGFSGYGRPLSVSTPAHTRRVAMGSAPARAPSAGLGWLLARRLFFLPAGS